MYRHALLPTRFAAALAPIYLLVFIGATHASSVKATVNGTVDFESFIQFSLREIGEPSTFFEVGVGPGASAANIAEGIEFEIDNTFGFDAVRSGNMVTVDGVIGELATAPAQLQMEWEVNTMGGSLPPMPDLPLANAPRPGDCVAPGLVCNNLSLFLAGPDGTSVPIMSTGAMVVAMNINGSTSSLELAVNATVPFDPSMSTDDLNEDLDTILAGLSLPGGVSYLGLNNGFPTFSAEEPIDFSVLIGTTAQTNPGIRSGFIAFGVPEPGSAVILLLAVSGLAILRRELPGRRSF